MNFRHHLIGSDCLSILSCQSAGTSKPSDAEPEELKGTHVDKMLQQDVMRTVSLKWQRRTVRLWKVSIHVFWKGGQAMRAKDDGSKNGLPTVAARSFLINLQEAGERGGGTYFHTALVK